MDKQKKAFDFWYAVNNTRIALMPSRHLETFGTTVLHYHLVSALMDTVNQTRVREGRIQANRPQIITPEAYSRTILEGFGDEARNYVDWLKEHETEVRILQYGYRLRKELYSEHLISEPAAAVAERVENEVRGRNDPLSAVVVGVDEPWDVCLVKLFWEVIRHSVGPNVRDLERRRMFDDAGGVPRAVRDDIERAFERAARDPSQIKALGGMLHRAGLFEEYQDRFFSLMRQRRG
ncbi:MAG: hypothetical protein FJ225_12345 [Lentisphaerae bacterium]|nr:hypothetical protein [Lentisphaerota bacterium]